MHCRGAGRNARVGARGYASREVQGLVGLRRDRQSQGLLRGRQADQSNPKKIKRGPIFFYISQWPADKVVNEISVKMGYPFGEGAKSTVTIGTTKFEMFTKDEGAFVEKPEMETKLIEAMKTGSTMKIEGKSVRGTATSDAYSLNGLSDALDRAAKECSG